MAAVPRNGSSRLFTPENQVRLAWFNLVASLIGLPITIIVTDEPPFILGLSWYAVTITALGWISAAQANREVTVQAEQADVDIDVDVDARQTRGALTPSAPRCDPSQPAADSPEIEKASGGVGRR